ncbi:MAG: hypothetical protein LBD38_02350 [Streptococcaceae bacterium]|nr:hypothetical protein [Streptococcaceae bacterium]
METVETLITVVGTIFTIRGLFSVLTGAMDFFSGRKNENPSKVDSGVESMIAGGVMSVLSGGITAAILSAISELSL